jgi:hypothetical protein
MRSMFPYPTSIIAIMERMIPPTTYASKRGTADPGGSSRSASWDLRARRWRGQCRPIIMLTKAGPFPQWNAVRFRVTLCERV